MARMSDQRIDLQESSWRALVVMGLYAHVATTDGLTLLDERTVPLAASKVLAELAEYPPQLAWLAMPSDSPPVDVREALSQVLDHGGAGLPEGGKALATRLTAYWLQCLEEQSGRPEDLVYLITLYGASDWLLSKPRMAVLSRSRPTGEFPHRDLRRAWLKLKQFVHAAEHVQSPVDRTTAAHLAARVLDCAEVQGVVGLSRDRGRVVFVPPRDGWL